MSNMSKLTPLAGYVLIEPVDEEQTTASGLVMPDKEKEKPAKGKIIAVGQCLWPEGMGVPIDSVTEALMVCPQVKVGNLVIFHKWAGQDVKEGQKEYRLVQFKDLMGVYK